MRQFGNNLCRSCAMRAQLATARPGQAIQRSMWCPTILAEAACRCRESPRMAQATVAWQSSQWRKAGNAGSGRPQAQSRTYVILAPRKCRKSLWVIAAWAAGNPGTELRHVDNSRQLAPSGIGTCDSMWRELGASCDMHRIERNTSVAVPTLPGVCLVVA